MEKFENQYILFRKDQRINPINQWVEICFQDYTLYRCPNLTSYEFSSHNNHFVLLGFSFHAMKPEWDENDILRNMPSERNAFLEYIDYLCGNYLLLIEISGDLIIYTDTSSTLKAFYFQQEGEILGVGPDTSILTEYLDLKEYESEEVKKFYACDFFVNNRIRLGDKSKYQDTLQLLPNHQLNVNSNTVERYFPRTEREELKLDDAIERVHQYFSNIIDAAALRYDLKCSITAGWDSRMVVSFTKNHHDQIDYYTFKNPPFKQSHPDLSVSKSIAEGLKLNYRQLERPIELNDKEIEDAKASFQWLDELNIAPLLGGFSKFNKPNELLLIGNVSEICKNYFEDIKITNGKLLTQAAHFPMMKYTVDHFEQIYQEHKRLEEEFHYDLRDMVHWEQDICNFAAMGIMYRSLVTKTFSPFNCRAVIDTILRTPREYRDKQQHHFYKSYIEKYYQELNKFKINPDLKSKMIVFMKTIGFYNAYKRISTKLRK